VNLY